MDDRPNTVDSGKPRRRWFQFRLRTLLVGATVIAVYCPVGARNFREWQEEREIESIAVAVRAIDAAGHPLVVLPYVGESNNPIKAKLPK